jgi:hypothetical protein
MILFRRYMTMYLLNQKNKLEFFLLQNNLDFGDFHFNLTVKRLQSFSNKRFILLFKHNKGNRKFQQVFLVKQSVAISHVQV